MKSIAVKLSLMLLGITAAYAALAQIPWTRILHVESIQKISEEKLGNLYWDFISSTHTEIHVEDVIKPIDSIANRLLTANNISPKSIRIHVVENPEVNAFALPNRMIIINSGLLANAGTAEEFAGVLAHEIAHIEENHVMSKLRNELGIQLLLSITSSNRVTDQLLSSLKVLTSTAFSRTFEREADQKGISLMKRAKIDIRPLAHFFDKLEKENNPLDPWISTHPLSEQRSQNIKNTIQDQTQVVPLVHPSTWTKCRLALE